MRRMDEWRGQPGQEEKERKALGHIKKTKKERTDTGNAVAPACYCTKKNRCP